jgi:tripartite ATP-independent transporter DctM subunit
MDPLVIGSVGIAVLIFLIVCGVPVAFAAGGVGLGGLMLLRNPTSMLSMVGGIPMTASASYTFSVLPLFIAIGFLAFHAGLTVGAFRAAKIWFGRLPGGLASATLFANTGFAAVSGSSVASTSVFTQLAMPELEKAGYGKSISAGVIAIGGTLAALIPPSAILVLYGILVDESIGKLLLAGIVPGLISLTGYVSVLAIISVVSPGSMPRLPRSPLKAKVGVIKDVWGLVGVIGVILGGIYFGWMTPTESAAVAVGIIFVMALMHGMRFKQLSSGLLESVKTTAMIFTILWSMLIFVRFLAFTGLPNAITEGIIGLNVAPWVVMLCIIGLYLVLGMLLDGIGMMILTVPILFPAVMSLGYDPIWFGILVVKLIEIGLVTPPVGLNCYVVNGIRPDIPLHQIFRGVAPFLMIEAVILALILFFPQIVLFLPQSM